jgi:hypothetical protein
MNIRVILLSAAAMTLALFAASPSPKVDAAPDGYMEVVSFDTGVERSRAPLPVDESARFNHFNPTIRWASSRDAVEYLVVGRPDGIKADAVDSAVETLDKEIDSRRFKRISRSKQKNPCTGEPNTISWEPGDGPGGVLAMAGVCYNTKTNEIAGFRVVLDSMEDWSTKGKADKFDVESVLAHEMGHVAGLDHVNGRSNALLTMYPSTAPGETHKRSLGKGDKSGLDALYGRSADADIDKRRSKKDKKNRKGEYVETGGPNLFWD